MSFDSAWLLWLLAAVPAAIAGYRRLLGRRRARQAELAADGLVLTGAGPGWRRHLPFALFLSALASLLIGAARPQVSVGLPRREGTVILAFDVSNSMLAGDLEPNRIQAAQAAAKDFVAGQPPSIRIGVVTFGDGGFVAQEPTDVRADVEAAIDRLSTQGGTALGAGIFSALSAIAGEPLVLDEEALYDDLADVDIGYYSSAAVIVLSDGENTAGPDPVQLAELASVAGVDIHTIGLGRPEGTVVEIDGFSVATALDEPLLTAVAEATGGGYHPAGDADALAQVYDSIDLEVVTRTEPREVTALFTVAGMAALAVGAALSLAWFGRVA